MQDADGVVPKLQVDDFEQACPKYKMGMRDCLPPGPQFRTPEILPGRNPADFQMRRTRPARPDFFLRTNYR